VEEVEAVGAVRGGGGGGGPPFGPPFGPPRYGLTPRAPVPPALRSEKNNFAKPDPFKKKKKREDYKQFFRRVFTSPFQAVPSSSHADKTRICFACHHEVGITRTVRGET